MSAATIEISVRFCDLVHDASLAAALIVAALWLPLLLAFPVRITRGDFLKDNTHE